MSTSRSDLSAANLDLDNIIASGGEANGTYLSVVEMFIHSMNAWV